MRKKSLLISGALLLGAALSVSTYAVLTSPQFADENSETTEPGTPELTITNTVSTDAPTITPASGSTILSTDPLSVIQVNFPTGDKWVSVVPSEDLNITITKDGEPWLTVPTVGNCKAEGRSYPGLMYVTLPQPIKEAGEYVVTIPEGLCVLSSEDVYEEGATEDDPNILVGYNRVISQELKINYTVKFAFETVFSPASGDVMPGGLDVVTITYPEGTVINLLDPGEKVVNLVKHNSNGEVEDPNASEPKMVFDIVQTQYSVKAEGNVVTLTALNPENIKSFTKNANFPDLLYDYISIPANMWSASLDGVTLNNPAFAPKYWVTAFVQSAFEISPAPGSVVAPQDFDNIIIRSNSPVTWVNYVAGDDAANKTKTVGYLKIVDNGSPRYVAYLYPKNISANGKVLTLGVQAILPTNTTGLNNLSILPNAKGYYIELNKNMIANAEGTKNPLFTWSNYEVQGGQANEPITYTTPAPGRAYDASYGGPASVTFNTYFSSYVANPDAVITLKRNGEVYATWKASETSTANALIETKGASSINYKLATAIAKDEYGEYTLSVEEGAFKAVGFPNLSAAYEGVFYMSEKLPFTVSPEGYVNGVSTGLCESLDKIVYTFADNVTVKPFDLKAGNPTYGKNTIANIDKGSASSASSTFKNLDIAYEGNKLILTFDPMTEALSTAYGWMVRVPRNMFLTEVNGVEMPNEQMEIFYQINNVTPGYMVAASNSYDALAPVENLSDLATLWYYQASQTLVKPAAAFNATLRTPAGKTIATYTSATTVTDSRWAKFTTTDDLSAAAVESATQTIDVAYRAAAASEGVVEYDFVIPANTFGYGTTTTTSTMFFRNPNELVVKIPVIDNTVSVNSIFDEVEVIDVIAIDGRIVARGINRAELCNLPAGLYIAGGKKVLVK